MYLGYRKATIDFSVDDNLSDIVDIRDADMVSLEIPTIDGPACDVTFEGAASRTGTYQVIKKLDGTTFTITATTGGFSVINISEIAGYGWIKIATSVAQIADREFKIILKKTG